MTVREAITRLQALDPELPLLKGTSDGLFPTREVQTATLDHSTGNSYFEVYYPGIEPDEGDIRLTAAVLR